MLFNSVEFALFFPIVTLLYWLTPYRRRWLVLLLASCGFYMAFIPIYITILLGTIVVDYAAGLLIERASGRRRRAWLLASLIANIGVLAVFKYYNFFIGNLEQLGRAVGWSLSLPALSMLLPIGLSFHTFQAMAYTIEVYRGRQTAERHFGIYALYVMFYPQLVAGPIERPQNLLHQFHEPHPLNPSEVSSGLKRMAWGLFKKVVISDRLAAIVNTVYGTPTGFGGAQLFLGTFFFAWQIYCDFSGYSDIALGAAEVMGFKLMTNFRRPYGSASVREFWTRWHVSLSTWFRDFVYLPLGGNRATVTKWVRNIMITFAISGLWHGAKWTYVAWGVLNGLYLVGGRLTEGPRRRIRQTLGLDEMPLALRSVQIVVTFLLILVSWVFFRADSLPQALFIIRHWFVLAPVTAGVAPVPMRQMAEALAIVAGLAVVEGWLGERADPFSALSVRPVWIRWAAYYAAAAIILFFGVFKHTPFIYFQF